MPTTILASSLPDIHQNSNLTTGGGTDDTLVLQAALSGVYVGGLNLVIDGVSLITGLDVGSNTTITFNFGCGFYLANASNREAIRNTHRSASVITDTNITLTGPGEINGNKAGQSGVLQSDNTPICGIGFYGISNLIISGGLTVYDSAAWEIGIGNFSNVVCDSLSLTATTATSNLNTDGIDLRGPGTIARLSNLTILAGDDSIALNSRDYGSAVIGPYIGGGDISDVTIENIVMQGSLFGVDLISDGSFEVSDVRIYNLSGTVQNYALYLNLDIFNSPAGDGNFQNITLNGSTVTQVGTPFGSGIPPGLYVIGGVTSGIQVSGISPLPQTINLSATASTVTGLKIGSGTPFNANGEMLVNLQGLSFVQSAAGGLPAGSATFGNPCTAGSWILVYVLCFPVADALTGIGDGVNTYAPVAFGTTPASGCYLYQVTQNTSDTALTITPTFANIPGVLVIVALEYVGQQPTNPIDVVSALLTETSTNYVANPVTTTKVDDTVIGLGYYSGSSIFAAVSPAILRIAAVGVGGSAEDLLAATVGTYAPATTSDSATFAWFTVAAFGQNPTPPPILGPIAQQSGVIKAAVFAFNSDGTLSPVTII